MPRHGLSRSGIVTAQAQGVGLLNNPAMLNQKIVSLKLRLPFPPRFSNAICRWFGKGLQVSHQFFYTFNRNCIVCFRKYQQSYRRSRKDHPQLLILIPPTLRWPFNPKRPRSFAPFKNSSSRSAAPPDILKQMFIRLRTVFSGTTR